MKISLSYQSDLFDMDAVAPSRRASLNGRSGAFVDNMVLPVHRWFRYSAGFSSDWVRWLVRERRGDSPSFAVLDPFCGVGTTLLACDAENIQSWGFETHPFVYRIANAKLRGIHADLSTLKSIFRHYADSIPQASPVKLEETPPLLAKCYTPQVLSVLFAMRDLFVAEFDRGTPESELLWLALTAILRPASGVGTAQWQYVLPNKTKSGVQTPLVAFQSKASEMLQDVEYAQRNGWRSRSHVLMTDARAPVNCSEVQVDAVVTSPPYPNNYDYADSTRLEMTFWGEISGWGDLQRAVRRHLIRSCSQHAAAEKLVLDDLLSESVVDPIRQDLSIACCKLAEIRKTKGGRKNYHTMAAAYFRDLGLVFRALRARCRPDSFMCFVVGDSAPYGVYLSVDKWLGELALAAGFKSYSFEKIRDRNIKWKNRKHRVPLKEGRLWIER
ncbi:MAG: DNA modification methylase [Planctomycetota bacterium]|jgi:hypothetical protein